MLSILRDLESMTITLDVTKQIISNALNSGLKDFEDSIQFYTALSNKKIESIVTRNPRDFKNNDISVFTPEEALRIIETV
jgi:spore maturation protein CgeB